MDKPRFIDNELLRVGFEHQATTALDAAITASRSRALGAKLHLITPDIMIGIFEQAIRPVREINEFEERQATAIAEALHGEARFREAFHRALVFVLASKCTFASKGTHLFEDCAKCNALNDFVAILRGVI